MNFQGETTGQDEVRQSSGSEGTLEVASDQVSDRIVIDPDIGNSTVTFPAEESKIPAEPLRQTVFPKEKLDLRRMRAHAANNNSQSSSALPSPSSQFQPQQQPAEESKVPKAAPAADTSYFECNICLEQAKEPVVTQCGHLYCWPCIYTWMNQPRETVVCPVCKSGVSAETVIPIYTRENNEDPR